METIYELVFDPITAAWIVPLWYWIGTWGGSKPRPIG